MSIAKEVRTKIRSIKSTQKITRAMEMVAASKMRKAQERMVRAKPYAKKILQVIDHLAKSSTEYQHPFLQKREIKNIGVLIVTTDRGLCGGLNSNLLRMSLQKIKTWHNEGVHSQLGIIGVKGEHFFKRVGGKIIAECNHLGDKPMLVDLIGVVNVMLNAYHRNEIDALYLSYNEFINTMKQTPMWQQLLPVTPDVTEAKNSHWDYIYEPDNAKILLEHLLTRYIEAQVYRGVIENNASEQAARMMAMKNATDNAAELIDELELIYHKARQASITRELTEIVAGASVV